ncbi:hypothetical protein KFE25_008073 [Diacronema lutheri]|uniref:non-specific serine/threonine protein kinase n=1 Tax=Diacronema lutheri TaxID=2081491 RepID=A0A8J5XN78_DIALT|nr:hypothetical protein KFE25_008073 [Diacronema lutheri]
MLAVDEELRIPGDEGREYVIAPRAEIKGTGGFAEVRVARCTTTDATVAVKIIKLRPVGKMDERTVLREVRIMRQASSAPHPNVIRVLDVHIARGDTRADLTRASPLGAAGTAYIVLELCNGGELFDRLTDFGRVPEPNACHYMRGLLQGVAHLHERGVIHRDIKLENVLLSDDGTVKLADFGLAAELAVDASGAPINANALLRDVVGSQSYVAPEVLVRKMKGYRGAPVDAWSCGVCLFTLLSGFFPLDVADARDWRFRRLQAEQALGNLRACHVIFSMYQRDCPFSEAVQALLDGLLRVDPAQRMTVPDALRTAWLQPGDDAKDEHGAFESGAHGDGVVYRSFLGFGSFAAPAAPLAPEMLVPKRQAAHEASVLGQAAERAGALASLSRAGVAAAALAVVAAVAAAALVARRAR